MYYSANIELLKHNKLFFNIKYSIIIKKKNDIQKDSALNKKLMRYLFVYHLTNLNQSIFNSGNTLSFSRKM